MSEYSAVLAVLDVLTDPDRVEIVSSDRPVRKDVARNRAALLAAAHELISTRGVEVTLDDIASHAGVGVATAYRHFSNKQDLMQAVLAERIDGVVALMQRLEAAEDPMAALREFFFTVGQLQQTDRGLREVMSANHGMDTMSPHRDRLVPLATRLIERARQAGRLRADIDTTDLPLVIWIMGAITQYAGDVQPTLWRRYLELLLDGMSVDGEKRPLSEAPLTPDQVNTAMRAWGQRTRHQQPHAGPSS